MNFPSASEVFEQELRRRGVSFSRTDESGLYLLVIDGLKVQVSLDNAERIYVRDNDPTALHGFVDLLLKSRSKAATWEEARPHLYLSLEGVDLEIGEALQSKVTRTVRSVLVESDASFSKIGLVTSKDLERWGVPLNRAQETARKNLDSLLAGISVQTSVVAGKTIGMIPIENPFKASVILAPAFKDFVAPSMGWPVLVVAPCRDFVYVIPEANEELLGRMGGVVLREFRESGYPITAEVLRVSDEGLEAIGTFDPNDREEPSN